MYNDNDQATMTDIAASDLAATRYRQLEPTSISGLIAAPVATESRLLR